MRRRGLAHGARPVEFHDDHPRLGHREHSGDDAAPVLLTGFDVTRYTHDAPAPVEVDAEAIRDSIQVDDIFVRPAGDQDGARADLTIYDVAKLRRDLSFLREVDAAVYTETRTMYSSWTVNEARITAFVATWMWERLGWAHSVRKLCEVLPSAHETTGFMWSEMARDRFDPWNRLRRVYVDRLQPTIGTLWSMTAGERVTAGHMARLAIQEGSLLAGYKSLLPRVEQIPEAHRVLSEIISRRERAADFFVQEALNRIHRSLGECLTAAVVLAVGGDPLRPAGVRLPKEEWARMSLYSTPESRADLKAAFEVITDHLPALPVLGVRRYLERNWRS